ncbi:MAG: TetR/AcrR family transcriptional regulator [Chloroflexota bacterium]
MVYADWFNLQSYIQQLEREGKITRTFRRLDATRQQAVINAILEEATEKGPASLNIKEIARRAEVSVGSLYQYFPNRDGLLDFAIELCVRYMTNMFEMSRPYLMAMQLREALNAYINVGLEWGKTETGLVRFFARAAYQGDPSLGERIVRPVAEAMRKVTFGILENAAQRGEIRAEADLDAVSRLVNGLMIVVGDSQMLPYLNTYFQITDDNVSQDHIVGTLVQFILQALS